MIFTTKGRYAVMAMADIAEHGSDINAIKLSDISKRQNITTSYLEQIFTSLRKAGLVSSVRGPGGGYKLSKPANEISVYAIAEAVGEEFKISGCTPTHPENCSFGGCTCSTHKFWARLENHIEEFLSSAMLGECLK